MKILAIHPRQSGKTTKGLYEFKKDPDNTLLILHNLMMIKHIKRSFRFSHKNIISVDNFNSGEIDLRRVERIIIDEYLFLSLSDKKKLHDTLKFFNKEINIFTTADRVYDEELVNRIKVFDKSIITPGEISVVLYKKYGIKYDIVEIDKLYHNFITDNDCYITTDVNNKYEGINREFNREYMDEDWHNLYILNKFFK